MNFKILKYIFASILIFTIACNKQANLVPTNTDWDGENFGAGGGLLDLTSPSLNYIVGDGKDYNVEFKVFQGASNKTVKVEVYCTLHKQKIQADTIVLDADGNSIFQSSNEKLLNTIDITEQNTHFESFSINFAELEKDLKIDDKPVPTDDGQMSIGDYWTLKFVSTTEDGKSYENYKSTKVSVSTRFAGTYTCSELSYYRINVLSPSYWLGDDLIIESVNATTYKYHWGETIGWDGPLYFQIDPTTNAITYPAEWNGTAQTLNGQPLTCLARNPSDLTNVSALTTTPDIAIKDDVEGKDKLIMVYGYYTAGSGPREFYEVLVKKVN